MITKEQYSIFEKQFGQAVADKRIATFGDAAKYGMDWMYNAMQAEIANMIPTDQYEADMGVQRAMIGDLLKEKDQLQADIREGAKLITQWVKAYEAEKAENEKLQAENAAAIEKDIRQYDRIEALDAENDRLRGELSEILRISERGDVNVQPLLAPIVEKAKNALEK